MPVQRLRPNLRLDFGDGSPFPEDDWLGRTLRIGTVELRIVDRCERCVMVGHPQAELESQPRILKTIGRVNAACAGVYAQVITPGDLRQGDAVLLA